MIRAIALFKLLKALILIGGGIGALKLMNEGAGQWFARLAESTNLAAHPKLFNSLFSKVTSLDPRKVAALGVGSFVYGALFLVEGIGLWLQKRWAEYLTIVTTAGFIPFEIYELTRKTSAERIIVLVVNVAILVYLVWRVRSERHEKREPRKRAPMWQTPQPAR